MSENNENTSEISNQEEKSEGNAEIKEEALKSLPSELSGESKQQDGNDTEARTEGSSDASEKEGTESGNEAGEKVEASEDNWEAKLNEPLDPAEMKRREKLEKRLKKERKQKEMMEKTQKILDKEFSNIFNERVTAYTTIFFLFSLTNFILYIAYLRGANGLDMQWWQITLGLSFIIGSVLMLWLTSKDGIYKSLFEPQKTGIKVLIYLLMIAVGFGLSYLYWRYTDSIETGSIFKLGENGDQITIDALRYQTLFGAIFMIIFFGWNVIQIFFIRNAFDNLSLKTEVNFEVKNENLPLIDRKKKANMYNMLILIIPIVFHLVFTWIFVYMDTPKAWELWLNAFKDNPDLLARLQEFVDKNTHKFTPDVFFWSQYVQQQLALGTDFNALEFGDKLVFVFAYFRDVWWSYEPLRYIFIWVVIVLILIIISIAHQIKLISASNMNDTPNVFTGWWYFWFWVLMWFKLFPIIKTAISLNSEVVANLSWYDYALDIVVDLLLMIFTILLVLRSFGMKLKALEKPWLKAYNSVFLLFLFGFSYFTGQMTLLTGGVIASMNQLKLTTNIVVVIVNLIFYFWYSGWILERKGFNRKQNYTLYEAKDLLIQLAQRIRTSLLDTIENREIITTVLNEFMLENKIALKGKVDERDAVVLSLDEEKEEEDSRKKLKELKDALNEALVDQVNYEKAVEELNNLNNEKEKLIAEKDILRKEIDSSQTSIESDFEAKKAAFESMNAALESLKSQINAVKAEMQSIKIPALPEPKQYASEQYSEQQIAKLKQEEQEKIEKINAEIAELEKNKNNLKAKMEQLNSDFQAKSNELTQLTPKYEESKLKYETLQKGKQDLESKTVQIADLEKAIIAKEKDLEILKQRKEESQPLVDAAKLAVESAEKEVISLQELEAVKKAYSEADLKVLKATDKRDIAIKILEEADTKLNITTPIPECEKNIDELKRAIKEKSGAIEDFQKALTQLTELEQNKRNEYTEIKKKLVAEEQTLSGLNSEYKDLESQLNKAKAHLESQKNLQSERANAKTKYEEIKQANSKIDSVEAAEMKFKDLENKEKALRKQLKEMNKDENPEIKTKPEYSELLQKIDEIVQQKEAASQNLANTKEAAKRLEKAEQTLKQLENQTLDITAAEKRIAEIEAQIKEVEAKVKKQTEIVEPIREQEQKANKELQVAENNRKNKQEEINKSQAELDSKKQQLAKVEADLEARKKAEANKAKAEKDLKEAESVLEKAKAKLEEEKGKLHEVESRYDKAKGLTQLDKNIYKAELALRKAYQTLKEAIKSAELNVKVCQQKLEEAKKVKADALGSQTQS